MNTTHVKDLPVIEAQAPKERRCGIITCVLLVAFTAASILFIQSPRLINADVSFLAWTARQVMGPAVFGVDIYEVNPPLAFMIYTPAALMVPLLGYDLAIKLWVTALACLSVAMFWQTCDARLRLPLTIALALFIAFVLPEGFAQREQIAFMLTAPYVAGPCRHRGRAILIGVMAGVGFAIKPHFLIPLVLVFATRRRVRSEEWAIAVTGLAYAAALLLFFRPYLFEVIPVARATYWAIHLETANTWSLAAFILLPAVALSLAGAPQPEARGFLAATIGFTLAALIQFKGFVYHFPPALGYLVLFLVARVFNAWRPVAVCAVICLLTIAYLVGGFTLGFATPSERQKTMALLLPEIDRSSSFLSFALQGFPGFPTALYTTSEFKGISGYAMFVKAARDPTAGPELQERARQLAIAQATRELERKPELVVVARQDSISGVTGEDLLSFFKADARFAALWDDYRFDKTISGYDFYRRRN